MEEKKKPGRPKNNFLSCQDICVIIMICSKAGVKKFKAENLEVSFQASPTPQHQEETEQSGPIVLENQEKNYEPTVEEEIEAKESELARMIIEDPSQYEDLLARGELEDRGEPNAES